MLFLENITYKEKSICMVSTFVRNSHDVQVTCTNDIITYIILFLRYIQ